MIDYRLPERGYPTEAPIARRQLAQLYRTQRFAMLRWAQQRLGDTAAAEDAVQSTFACVMQAGFGRAEFLPSRQYLFVALRRHCAREAHANYRCTVDVMSLELLLDTGCDVERECEVQVLWDSIECLPAQCRRVITYYLAGYTYAEISRMAGISSNTVNAHLQRAKHLLREDLRYKETSGAAE